MPRFVILEHDHPFLHWDLMLERDAELQTWRLLELPRIGFDIPAVPLAPHRLHYLEYEGPVSGNRGSVRRVASGEYHLEDGSGCELMATLCSTDFSGRLVLSGDGKQWTARFEPISS